MKKSCRLHLIAAYIQTHAHAMMTVLKVKVMTYEHDCLAAADLLKNEMKKKMKTFQNYLQTLLNEEMLSSSEKMNEKKFEIVVSSDEEKKNEEENDD
ncbi:predicted protein [Uncinocarpus reesii 1704]|uniref:Uncharacterized protein n=1 Tax=Uncinocarpus reesii (strain UAMH 1704) TaxID=336963 RepID=C4JXW2_UNCRE|nr:uncharacterized protein UREG_07900 [Uncinocarpus reesii 1704]EEP83035.1 predicted protein [Uncinocarpus reesii 1704]